MVFGGSLGGVGWGKPTEGSFIYVALGKPSSMLGHCCYILYSLTVLCIRWFPRVNLGTITFGLSLGSYEEGCNSCQVSCFCFCCCERHHGHKLLGEERVYFILQVTYSHFTVGGNSRQEMEAETREKLCVLICSQACAQLDTPAKGWCHPQWAGATHIHQRSEKGSPASRLV